MLSVLSGMLLQRKEDLELSDGSPQNVVCGCGHTKFYAKFNDAVHTLLFEPLGKLVKKATRGQRTILDLMEPCRQPLAYVHM